MVRWLTLSGNRPRCEAVTIMVPFYYLNSPAIGIRDDSDGDGGGLLIPALYRYLTSSEWLEYIIPLRHELSPRRPRGDPGVGGSIWQPSAPEGLYSLSRKTSYRKISWSLEVARFNCSENWQASRQQRCRDACQISVWNDHYNTQSRGFETSRDLAVRRLTA